MKCKLIDFAQSFSGDYTLTLQLHNNIEVDELKDKELELSLKPYRNKRSLDANAYFWELCGKLAVKLNRRTNEIYREYIKDIGDNYEIVCVQEKALERLIRNWTKNGLGWQTETLDSKIDGCKNVVLYYGSSEFDTKQMSRLIDFVVTDCKAQGIETLTPIELKRLTDDWGDKNQT